MVPVVVVTGFGPFRNYTENSSWLTVKELSKLNITEYKVVAKELSVEYEAVSEAVPQLWQEYSPQLMIHCGMSAEAKCLTLEKLAFNKDYNGCDIKGNLPVGNVCCNNGPEVLHTAIDIDKVLKDIHSVDTCVLAQASENAGRYLCEFIFYTSLKINRNTAFVHVPPLSQHHTAQQMAKTLSVIISTMLTQITQ